MTFSCCRAASKAVRHLSYSLVPSRSPSVRHFWSSSSAVSCREAQPANTKPTAIISATLIGTPCSAVSASLSRHDEVSTSRGIIGYNEKSHEAPVCPKSRSVWCLGRQTVTLSRKPENLLGRYRLLPSIVTTAPSIPVYGMLRGPDSGAPPLAEPR